MRVRYLIEDLILQDKKDSLVFIQINDKTFAEIKEIYIDKEDRVIIAPVEKGEGFVCEKAVY